MKDKLRKTERRLVETEQDYEEKVRRVSVCGDVWLGLYSPLLTT